jgi:hypothetical protein
MSGATQSLSSTRLPPFPLPSAYPARQQFFLLEQWLASPQTLQLPLHEVEYQQEHKGREVQRLLLQTHIQQRGHGVVGPALRVNEGLRAMLSSHRRLHTRRLKTIFGPIDITRMSYSRPGAESIHPLDEALQLPARSFSYELQKRMVKAAVQGTFREARERMAEITGAPVPTRSIEEVIQDAAQDFDAFYAQRTPKPWTETGPILVAAVEGQGNSHDQARQGATPGTADQGAEGQPQEDGHGGRCVYAGSLDSDSPAGGGKPLRHGPDRSR